jgi:hypothetical protein
MEFLEAGLRRIARVSGDGENQSGELTKWTNSSLTRESRKQSETPKLALALSCFSPITNLIPAHGSELQR